MNRSVARREGLSQGGLLGGAGAASRLAQNALQQRRVH
jgi:hypothetical protein